MEIEVTTKNETEQRYIKELKRFINSGKDVETYIRENIEDRKQLSKLKNGLKLIEFEDKTEILDTIDKEMTNKRKYIKKPEDQLKLRNMENSINRMKNTRLKLAYRLQEISGLRVSEISNLTINDIAVSENDNRIIINVVNGKGGKNRTVKCLYDKWVLEQLIKIDNRKNGKLFYSKSYLMTQARKKSNFHTHDLRKVFAHNKYFNNISTNAVIELQQDLGHNENTKTYLKYINRDINTNNTRWHNLEPLEDERV